MPLLEENGTSFVLLARLLLDILHFMFFKMARHLGFRGLDSLKPL